MYVVLLYFCRHVSVVHAPPSAGSVHIVCGHVNLAFAMVRRVKYVQPRFIEIVVLVTPRNLRHTKLCPRAPSSLGFNMRPSW